MYFFIFPSGFLHSDLQMTLNLIWWSLMDLGYEISDPKNLCMYFSGFFYRSFCSLTFKWPWIWCNGSQRTLHLKSATPKTYICIFLDFFYWIFSQKHCIEAVKFSFFQEVLGVIRGDEGGIDFLLLVDTVTYC